MWNKRDEEDAVGRPEAPTRPERRPEPSDGGGSAAIGRSITIRGEVIGEEDLVIEGRVEGSVTLKQHSVTVGPDGEVTAEIQGRVVVVEGHVEGDLHGAEQVILRESADVLGDIKAPRVTLEDGAYFRGNVEMTREAEREAGKAARSMAAGQSVKSGSSPSPSSDSKGSDRDEGDDAVTRGSGASAEPAGASG